MQVQRNDGWNLSVMHRDTVTNAVELEWMLKRGRLEFSIEVRCIVP